MSDKVRATRPPPVSRAARAKFAGCPQRVPHTISASMKPNTRVARAARPEQARPSQLVTGSIELQLGGIVRKKLGVASCLAVLAACWFGSAGKAAAQCVNAGGVVTLLDSAGFIWDVDLAGKIEN